jgi:arginase
VTLSSYVDSFYVMKTASRDLDLLFAEWQGYGEHDAVSRGAHRVAREIYPGAAFVTVPVRADGRLELIRGVLGLDSIAAGMRGAQALLNHHAPLRIFMIGGTCAAELAPIAYLNRLYAGSMAVLWFDAHGDLNTPESSPSGHFHGMPLRALLGEGPPEIVGAVDRPLTPDQVFLIGSRDLDPPEVAFVAQRSLYVGAPAALGGGEDLCRAIAARGFRRVYVHLDLDVLDPASFPDVLMPTRDGLEPRAVADVLRRLTSLFDVVGFSVVEFCDRTGVGIEALRKLLAASGIRIGCCKALGGTPEPCSAEHG